MTLLTDRTSQLAMLTAIALMQGACGDTVPQNHESPADDGWEATPFDGRTTQGDVAVGNLTATIDGQTLALERRPTDLALRVTLVDALLTRAQFMGTFADFDRSVAIAQDAVQHHPNHPRALELRARAYQAVHRFDEAQTDLEAAQALDGVDRSDAVATLLIARGTDLEQALRIRQEAAQKRPSFATLAGLGAALAALGRYDEADTAWVDALRHYRDVSPFPVAFVAFQRGVMWSEQADRPERGLILYREAVQHLPAYAVANVHLAELEWNDGDTALATERLRSVLDTTVDPEPGGLLGEILIDLGQSREATPLIAQARDRYLDLLERHPYAFLDHGAEFFMGPGAEPARALELALTNLDNRRNSRAFEIAIDAAEVNGDEELVCTLARQAQAEAQATTPLQHKLTELDHCLR